ncbi:hypothetical protein MNB_SV-3-1186 [hydrothermal vent metagenome]|uniref:Uncharacterized protein n=1 Tax=hydrothermal vent metagenome TaxID=652676 RepID=A0A1W1CMC9_9ZZZZ
MAVAFSYRSWATAFSICGCKLNFSNALMGYPLLYYTYYNKI